MKLPLADRLPDELATYFDLESPFRGDQIFKWIQGGSRDFESMTNLPLGLRSGLCAMFHTPFL